MSNEQSIEEEIARVIDKALDDWQGEGSEAAFVMARLSPLLNRVRAEALREARDNVRASSFWADGSDNYADRVRGYLSNAADVIEQNSEGNET